MKDSKSSRRSFLKSTIAGATVALGDLHKLALAGDGRVAAASAETASSEGPSSGAAASAEGGQYTRGVGVYPGDPRECFSPTLARDESSAYRNLALLRPAHHSSSYDYNLTAQLVTDGIKDTRLPIWVATSVSSQGELPKREREFFLDHNPTSGVTLPGPNPWVQVRLGGGESVPEIDRVEMLVVLASKEANPEQVSFSVSVSDDGWSWKQVGSVSSPQPVSIAGYPPRFARPGHLFRPSIPLNPVSHSRFYRME